MFKTLKIYCRADIVFCLVPDTGLISLNDIATSLWHSVHVLNQYHWLICVLLLFHVYHTEQGFIWYPTLGKLNLLVMIADCNGIPLHVKWLLSHYLASIYPNKKRYIYLIYHSIICVLLWLHVYHTEQGFMWYSPVRKLSLPAMIADHNVTPLLVKWLLYHLLAYCLLKRICKFHLCTDPANDDVGFDWAHCLMSTITLRSVLTATRRHYDRCRGFLGITRCYLWSDHICQPWDWDNDITQAQRT